MVLLLPIIQITSFTGIDVLHAQHVLEHVGNFFYVSQYFLWLLFADDMATVGKTPKDSQNSLDYLYKLGLDMNTNKTKIVVFRKRAYFY
jgi:hypothetical protein